jgi:hypothetical protein
MRKYENFSIVDKLRAIILTKIQEISCRLSYMSNNDKLNKFFDFLFDHATSAHFELFYGSSLDSFLLRIRDLDRKTMSILAFRVLVPFCKRTVSLQMKMRLIANNKKADKPTSDLLKAVLLGSLLLNKSKSEVLEILAEKFLKEDDAARETA